MKQTKLLLLMLLTALFCNGAWADDIVEVSSGSSTTYSNRPIATGQSQGASETIYLKDHIGLEAGTGFKRIIYHGTFTGNEAAIPIQVYIGNTTDTAPVTEAGQNSLGEPEDELICIFDGLYTVTAPNDAGEVLSFDVPNSFRYEGNNLRVVMIYEATDANPKLSRGINFYCAQSSTTDFKNTMMQQNNAVFSLVTSPFLWIETGVASDHNFKITDNTLPTQATVNEAYEATITVLNEGIDEAAGSYTVKYYFDDVEVGSADAVALAKDATTTFSFTYTPTTLGRHTSYAEIVFPDGASVKTSKVQMRVEESDPRWSWDFEDNSWPSGCYFSNYSLDSYVHLAANGYYITPADEHNDELIFITPLLHAQAGEAIYFDAAKFVGFFATPELNVMISTDRENWTTIKTISESEFTGAQVGGSSSSLYDFTNFYATVPTEGDYYVAFQGGARLDNFYGLKLVEVNHDVMVKEDNLPTSGMVNNNLNADITVVNLLDATEVATAAYYINGTKVGEADAQNLTIRSEKTFNFACMPHEAGTFNSYIELTLADGTTVRGSEVEITIAEEEPLGETLIGTYNSYSSSFPIATGYAGSFSDMVYKAAALSDEGIVEGTKIKGIVFKGYNTNSAVTAPVKMWIGNSTADTPVTGDDPTDDLTQTTAMTKIYDGNYTFEKGGSYGAANQVDVMTIMFDEPFEYDGTNLRIHAQCVQDASQNTVNFAYSSLKATSFKYYSSYSSLYTGSDNQYLPLIGLLYDKEASLLSGTLTIKNADGSITPIANTTITLTADDGVAYNGDTDVEGKFSFAVIQDKKTYTISFDYSEKNTLPLAEEDLSVTFSGTSVEKDIQLTEGVDFYIESSETPATGTINNKYTATVTAKNYNASTLASGDYTATLYVDGKAVAEAESVDVASMESATFTFSFTPHETGTFNNCYIELAGPTATAKTDAYTLTVNGESAGGEAQVGNKDANSSKTPFYWYDADTGIVMTDNAYTPEYLKKFGVEANSKITKITFKATEGTTTKNFSKVNLKVWIALEDTTTPFTAGDIDTSKMQPFTIYDDVAANSGDDIVLDFSSKPLVYDGTSRIRMYVENNGYGTYVFTNYPYDTSSNGQKSYYKKKSATSWTQDYGTPVAYFTLAAASHFTGSVKNEADEAISGATVTLTNAENDVVYSGKSDADGNFDVEVVQADKDYTVTVEADGYITFEKSETVSLSSGDSTGNNFVLANGVDITIAENATGTSYSGKYALDFSNAEVKAYKAVEKVATGGVKLTPVKNIPAETGIIVKGTAGTYRIPLLSATTYDDFSDNLLVANVEEKYTVTEEDYGYVYRYVVTTKGQTGFQKAKAGQTVSAGKAYLRLSEASANETLLIEEEADGIDTIATDGLDVNAPMYNLAGQRVERSFKGVVIQNGKKFIKK